MKRKSFTFEGLKFFERNKEDLDFIGATERFREHNFRFIQNNVSDSDERVTLLMKEMHENYTIEQLSVFMYGNQQEIKERIWDSYKVNPSANGELLSKEQLMEKIKGKENTLLKLILNLEAGKEDGEEPKKKTKEKATQK